MDLSAPNLLNSLKNTLLFPITFSRIGVGREITVGTYPTPKSKRIVVEIWAYLPRVYTFREEEEMLNKYSEQLFKKVDFP